MYKCPAPDIYGKSVFANTWYHIGIISRYHACKRLKLPKIIRCAGTYTNMKSRFNQCFYIVKRSVFAGHVASTVNRKLAATALGDGTKHTFDLGTLSISCPRRSIGTGPWL